MKPELPEELASSESLPALLLPYQRRLYEAVATRDVVICEKSRRIGVTWGIAALAVLNAGAMKSAGGMDSLYISYDKELAIEFVDTCAMWARAFVPAARNMGEFLFDEDGPMSPNRAIKAYRIEFPSGFDVVALSSRPRKLRGREGLLIIDEAAYVDDLAGLVTAAMAYLIWGGRVLIISTHDGTANPFNAMIVDARAGRTPYHVETITFDEALADGLYRRICLVRRRAWSAAGEAEWAAGIRAFYGDRAAQELDCIPAEGSGTWLSSALIERQMDGGIPVLRWSCPEGYAERPASERRRDAEDFIETIRVAIDANADPARETHVGGDFGRVADLSVFWPAQTLSDMTRRPFCVIELRNCPYEQQSQVLWALIECSPRFGGAALDAGGIGADLSERTAQRFGSDRVQQVKFTVDWYRQHMPRLKAAFEDRTTLIPRDADIMTDHRVVQVIDGVAQLPKTKQQAQGEKGKTRHGDSLIAHVLAWFASVSSPVAYAYEPAGTGATAMFERRRPDPSGDWRGGDANSGLALRRGAI